MNADNEVPQTNEAVPSQKVSHRLTLEKKLDELQQKQVRLARELREAVADEGKIRLQLLTMD